MKKTASKEKRGRLPVKRREVDSQEEGGEKQTPRKNKVKKTASK